MTLTELKYVLAVARERHFGRAAERCCVSQPSLSVAVKKLEDELNVSIFERRANDISITPIGELIIEQAQRVISETERILEIAENGRDPLTGPLRVGVIYTIGPYLLPPLIRELSNDVPKMPLYIEETYTSELLHKLRTGLLDVAIMADTISDTGFMTRELYQEDFVVAIPSHHPWANRNYVGPNELKDQTMLLLGAGHCFRDQILGVCPDLRKPVSRPDLPSREAKAKAKARRMVEGSSLQTICHMVAQGLGITVLPASAVPYLSCLPTPIHIIPFKNPAPHRRVIMVWRKTYTRTAAIDAIYESAKRLTLNGCVPLDTPPRLR
ncbi:LysR substrate-binding domain-containing protein [Sutterella megalosphaeroides]|uniref:Oxidative stress regulatory protein n=1 Tax=Sutterella megalosphaeroides TaxID=2494234 RepID=A0A2Z6IDI6_9BURK|nr:LysR substrate-binding domain-containing protein [Sutterella megalosphaeroides]BBF24010.1 oxidative stress regulatory protein [Sutterella megalosphaeroides]